MTIVIDVPPVRNIPTNRSPSEGTARAFRPIAAPQKEYPIRREATSPAGEERLGRGQGRVTLRNEKVTSSMACHVEGGFRRPRGRGVVEGERGVALQKEYVMHCNTSGLRWVVFVGNQKTYSQEENLCVIRVSTRRISLMRDHVTDRVAPV
eukprot:1176167-Prorocentrum_minimum.AAC.3